MAFKINISDKGKTFRIEVDSESLIGKKIGEKLEGNEINKDLEGYEFEVTGTSDNSGIPGSKDIDGHTKKRVLLTKGKFMKGKVKIRKKTKKIKGLRLKKTLRGNTISKDTAQINTKIVKHGHKILSEVFPDQNKPKEAAVAAA